jgi:thioredoxin reductase (NADPH)
MVAPSTKPFLLLTHSDECRISQQFQERLKRAAISLIHDKIASVVGKDGQLEALCTKGGRRIELDQLFSQQGATLQTKLAADVGVKLDDNWLYRGG